jgi:UDP-glucose 4-epimerase
MCLRSKHHSGQHASHLPPTQARPGLELIYGRQSLVDSTAPELVEGRDRYLLVGLEKILGSWHESKGSINRMRLLVTGGAGFIGSHLVEQLIAAGHDICVLDNFTTGKMRNLSEVLDSENLKVARADVRRIPGSLIRKLGRVNGLCHLAAVTDVQESIKNPILTSDVNLMGTLRVLETARKLKAERVVFASSAAVYGMIERFPVTEDARIAPISPYGASKAAAELYCRAFEENHGIEAVSLRYFNVYGPKQVSAQYSGVISVFARRILRGQPLTVFGDGSQSRDFVYVKDVVDATIRALKGTFQSRIFNIGSGTETTIGNLAETMQGLVGRRPEVKFLPPRLGDPYRGVADITKAHRELGFNPRTSLKDGLSTTIEW